MGDSKSKISNFVGAKFAVVPLCALEEVQCLRIASGKLPVKCVAVSNVGPTFISIRNKASIATVQFNCVHVVNKLFRARVLLSVEILHLNSESNFLNDYCHGGVTENSKIVAVKSFL